MPRLLGAHSNLFIALSPAPGPLGPPNAILKFEGTDADRKLVLDSAWHALLDKYSTRVVIGTDMFFDSEKVCTTEHTDEGDCTEDGLTWKEVRIPAELEGVCTTDEDGCTGTWEEIIPIDVGTSFENTQGLLQQLDSDLAYKIGCENPIAIYNLPDDACEVDDVTEETVCEGSGEIFLCDVATVSGGTGGSEVLKVKTAAGGSFDFYNPNSRTMESCERKFQRQKNRFSRNPSLCFLPGNGITVEFYDSELREDGSCIKSFDSCEPE